ncbi:MAG: MarC family protein [Chloroflexi bacterium]|nr:MarC family protein [Chloroflexota bacterium]
MSLLQFGAFAFVSLFAVIEPLGTLPIYISMTANLTPRESRRVALRATITALIVLIVFALTGRSVFDFFGISVNSLRIVGGIVFFIMGYEMLQARLSRSKLDEETMAEYIEDVAITPLGIPLIAGPGAITTVILLMNDARALEKQILVFLAIGVVLALTFVFLFSAKRVMARLGNSGNKVLLRLMGLIVMAMAVEFFFAGLRALVPGLTH